MGRWRPLARIKECLTEAVEQSFNMAALSGGGVLLPGHGIPAGVNAGLCTVGNSESSTVVSLEG